MTQSFRVLLAASAAGLAVGAAACSDSTAPSGQAMTLSFSSRSPTGGSSVGSLSPSYAVTVTGGGNTLVITRAQLVIREVELKRTGAENCPDGVVGDGNCKELEFGPLLVDLPLNSGVTAPRSISVPQGQYRELELDIHKPSGDAGDAAFVAANPLFANSSIRVEGTFNGTPFVFTSRLNEEIEVEFNPMLTVDATGGNITIQIDVASWFKNASSGAVIDPNTANSGGVNEGTVKEQIKRSIRALDDDDRDGR